MQLPVPTPELAAFARALDDAGFDALLVGGTIRDALLRRPTADLDLVTNASPDEVRELTEGAGWARRTYPVGERFGTVGVVLADGDTVEVSRYRSEALDAVGTAARFALDAAHRDFTVNAIALDLTDGAVLDPVGGRADLAARLLRAPGSPADRFAEDPLRVLRTARFVSELGFEVQPQTAAELRGAAPLLADVAVERVRDELTKLLVGRNAPLGLELLRTSDALEVVLPEIAALDGLTQPTFHDLDVLAHTFQTVGIAPATLALRWAALLHDVGKGPTRTVEADGRIRFYRHSQVGAELAETICRRLRLSNADTAAIVHLVAEHMRLGDVDFDNPRAVDRAVRKLDLFAGGAGEGQPAATAEDAVALTLADFAATAHRDETPLLRERLEGAIAASRTRGTQEIARSPVSGSELMIAFGLAEGPEVGEAKDAIERAIDEGEIAPDDRAAALRVAGAALGYHLDTIPRPQTNEERP